MKFQEAVWAIETEIKNHNHELMFCIAQAQTCDQKGDIDKADKWRYGINKRRQQIAELEEAIGVLKAVGE